MSHSHTGGGTPKGKGKEMNGTVKTWDLTNNERLSQLEALLAQRDEESDKKEAE